MGKFLQNIKFVFHVCFCLSSDLQATIEVKIFQENDDINTQTRIDRTYVIVPRVDKYTDSWKFSTSIVFARSIRFVAPVPIWIIKVTKEARRRRTEQFFLSISLSILKNRNYRRLSLSEDARMTSRNNQNRLCQLQTLHQLTRATDPYEVVTTALWTPRPLPST